MLITSLPSIAPFQKRFKAFIVDSFMLLMPILYIVFYLIYGSREGFAAYASRLASDSYSIWYCHNSFLKRSGQTPGYKAYDLILIDLKTQQKPSILQYAYAIV